MHFQFILLLSLFFSPMQIREKERKGNFGGKEEGIAVFGDGGGFSIFAAARREKEERKSARKKKKGTLARKKERGGVRPRGKLCGTAEEGRERRRWVADLC